MQLKYLKYCQKWCLIFRGQAVAVGDTTYEAIEEGFRVFKIITNRK